MDDQASSRDELMACELEPELAAPLGDEFQGDGLLDRANLVRDKDSRRHPGLVRYALRSSSVEESGVDHDRSLLSSLNANRAEVRTTLDEGDLEEGAFQAEETKPGNTLKVNAPEYRHWRFLSPGDVAQCTKMYQSMVDEIRQFEDVLEVELKAIRQLPPALSQSLQINDRLLADREESLAAYTILWNQAKENAARVELLHKLQNDLQKAQRTLSEEKLKSETLNNECEEQNLRNKTLSHMVRRGQAQIGRLEKQMMTRTSREEDYQRMARQLSQIEHLYQSRTQEVQLLEEYCLKLQNDICVTATNLEMALDIQNRLPFDLMAHWEHDTGKKLKGSLPRASQQSSSTAPSALLDFNEKETGFESLADLRLVANKISPCSYASMMELPAGPLKFFEPVSPLQKYETSRSMTPASSDPDVQKNYILEQTNDRSIIDLNSPRSEVHNEVSSRVRTSSMSKLRQSLLQCDQQARALMSSDPDTPGPERVRSALAEGSSLSRGDPQPGDQDTNHIDGYVERESSESAHDSNSSPISPFPNPVGTLDNGQHLVINRTPKVETRLRLSANDRDIIVVHSPPLLRKVTKAARSKASSPNIHSQSSRSGSGPKISSASSSPSRKSSSSWSKGSKEAYKDRFLESNKPNHAPESLSSRSPHPKYVARSSSNDTCGSDTGDKHASTGDYVVTQHNPVEAKYGQGLESHKNGSSQPVTDWRTAEGGLEFLPKTTYNPKEENSRGLVSLQNQRLPRASLSNNESRLSKMSRSRSQSISHRTLPLPVSKLNTYTATQARASAINTADTDADAETLIDRALDSIGSRGVIELRGKFRQHKLGDETGSNPYDIRKALPGPEGNSREPTLQDKLATRLQLVQRSSLDNDTEAMISDIQSLKNQLQSMVNELEITKPSTEKTSQSEAPSQSVQLMSVDTTPPDVQSLRLSGTAESQGSTIQRMQLPADGKVLGVEHKAARSCLSSSGSSTIGPEIDLQATAQQKYHSNEAAQLSQSKIITVLSESNLNGPYKARPDTFTSSGQTVISDGSEECKYPKKLAALLERDLIRSLLPYVQEWINQSDLDVSRKSLCCQNGRICFLGLSKENEVAPPHERPRTEDLSRSRQDTSATQERGVKSATSDRGRSGSSFILKTEDLSRLARQELHDWGSRHIFGQGVYCDRLCTTSATDGMEPPTGIRRSVSDHPGVFSPPSSVRSSDESRPLPLHVGSWDYTLSDVGSCTLSRDYEVIRPIDDGPSPDRSQPQQLPVDFNTAPTSPRTPADADLDTTKSSADSTPVVKVTTLQDLFYQLTSIGGYLRAAFRYVVAYMTRPAPPALGHWIAIPVVDVPWTLLWLSCTVIACVKAWLIGSFRQLAHVWSRPQFHLIAAFMCVLLTYLMSRMSQDWYTANTSTMRGKVMAWREEWWDWRILQHLRWHLQMAIERRGIRGEHAILT